MKLPDKEKAYGTVPDHFRRFVEGTLQKQDAPLRRRSTAVLLVAVLLIGALGTTALAVSQGWGPVYSETREARRILESAYGITPEMLSLFEESMSNNVYTGRTARYRPVNALYGERLGTYTIEHMDQSPQAVWSLDDKADRSALEAQGLEAEYWGEKQLAEVLALEAEYAKETARADKARKDSGPLTIEEAAARDAMLVEANYPGALHILPGGEDIPVEAAIETAKEAAIGKYGFPEDKLAEYTATVELTKDLAEEEALYTILLTNGAPDEADDHVRVTLRSPSGTVETCVWETPREFTLPEGSLEGYEEVVAEYVSSGAFKALSHAERAEVGARITEAGYGRYLLNYIYAAPDDATLPEAEVREAAYRALEAEYGIAGDMLTLFTDTLSLVRVQDRTLWVLDLVPDQEKVSLPAFTRRIGEYRITLMADTGALVQANWWFEEDRGFAEEGYYMEDTWGSAPGFTAEMLPWTMKFIEEVDAFHAEHGYDDEWSLETRAAYSEMFRKQGFWNLEFSDEVPMLHDLPEEEAQKLAEEALMEAYGLTGAQIRRMSVQARFQHVYDHPNSPVWAFTFHTDGPGPEDQYVVRIDPEDGTVISAENTTPGM